MKMWSLLFFTLMIAGLPACNNPLGSSASSTGSASLWSPSQLTGLTMWLDAADSTSQVLNAGNVSQWTDKSGSGNHMVQSTPSAQPTPSGGTLQFTTAKSMTSTYTVTPAHGWSVFFVAKMSGASNQRIVQANGGQNGLLGWWQGWQRATYLNGNPGWHTGAPAQNVIDTTMAHISGNVMTAAAANFTVLWDGNLLGTMNGASAAAYSWQINTGSFPGEASDFQMMEMIQIDGTITQANYQKVEGYLAWKWNLQSNLPAAHPYKQAAP